jgi:translation initiation factor IF-2
LQELKANPDRSAKGTVIEAGLHKAKGPLATFIVQNGTLKMGDIVVCGGAFGKVSISEFETLRTFFKIKFGAYVTA